MRKLLVACLAISATPLAAEAQLTTRLDPVTRQDVPYRFEVTTGEQDDLSLRSRDRTQRPDLAAFGNCVVDRDPAGSVAYVRAGASGREHDAYRAIRPSMNACRETLRSGRGVLEHPQIRLIAVADALRALRARQL